MVSVAEGEGLISTSAFVIVGCTRITGVGLSVATARQEISATNNGIHKRQLIILRIDAIIAARIRQSVTLKQALRQHRSPIWLTGTIMQNRGE